MARNTLPLRTSIVRCHQATRANHHVSRSAGLAPEKVINIEKYGNTTAGTRPLALTDAIAEGRLKKGDLVLIASVGAGFTVGSVLLRWSI